jgi:hypothetical protein
MSTPAYQQWVQAQFKAGKLLLTKFKNEGTWRQVLDPGWDWSKFDYRIDQPGISVKVFYSMTTKIQYLLKDLTHEFSSVGFEKMEPEAVCAWLDKAHPDCAPHVLVNLCEVIIKENEDLDDQLTKLVTTF